MITCNTPREFLLERIGTSFNKLIRTFRPITREEFLTEFTNIVKEINNSEKFTVNENDAFNEIWKVITEDYSVQQMFPTLTKENILAIFHGGDVNVFNNSDVENNSTYDLENEEGKRYIVSSRFLTNFFGTEFQARDLMVNNARNYLFQAMWINKGEIDGAQRGVVGTSAQSQVTRMNQNIRLYQEMLFKQIVDYLMSQNALNDIPEFQSGKRPTLYQKGRFVTEETGILSKIQPILELRFSKDIFTSDHISQLYQQRTDVTSKRKLDAYNAYVTLMNFDQVLDYLYKNKIDKNPNPKNLDELYQISDKGSSLRRHWRLKDAIVEDEVDTMVANAIMTLRRYDHTGQRMHDEYLSATDFANAIVKIKQIAIDGYDKDWVPSEHKDVMEELKNISQYVYDYWSQGKRTLAQGISRLREDPMRNSEAVFALFCTQALRKNHSKILSKNFQNDVLSNIHSIYQGVFNRHNTESYNALTRQNRAIYSYFTQTVDSLFPVRLISTRMNRDGLWVIRDFSDSVVANFKRERETTIDKATTRDVTEDKYTPVQKKYNVKSQVIQPKQGNAYTELTFDLSPNLRISINSTLEAPVYFTRQGPDYVEQTNNVQTVNNNIDVIKKFIDDALNLRIQDNKKLYNAIIQQYTNGEAEALIDLMRLAANARYIQWVMFNVKGTNGEYLVSKQDCEGLLKIPKYFQLNAKQNNETNTLHYNGSTSELGRITSATSFILTKIARAEAVINRLNTSSQLKDSLNHGQGVQSFSRLLGSFAYQWELIKEDLNNPTSETLLLNDNVFCGIAQHKEISDYFGTQKSTELFNVKEFTTQGILGYLRSFIPKRELDTLGKNAKGSPITVLASVNSDKPSIMNLLIDIDKALPERIRKHLKLKNEAASIKSLSIDQMYELMRYELGPVYQKTLNNILTKLNQVNSIIPEVGAGKIDLALDYLHNFERWNDYCRRLNNINNEDITPVERLRGYIKEYNLTHRHRPIKLTDQVHFFSDKNGNVQSNRTLINQIYRFGGNNSNLNLAYQFQDGKFYYLEKDLDTYNNVDEFYNAFETHLNSDGVVRIEFNDSGQKISVTIKNGQDLLAFADKYLTLTAETPISKLIESVQEIYNDKSFNVTFYNQIEIDPLRVFEIDGQPDSTFLKLNDFMKLKENQLLSELIDKQVSIYVNEKQPEYVYLRNEAINSDANDRWVDLDTNYLILGKIINPDGSVINITNPADMQTIMETYNFSSLNDTINAIESGKLNVILNPHIRKYNAISYLFSEEWQDSTVGSLISHPFKKALNALEEEASRFNAQHKRNVQHTAQMHEFQTNYLQGIPSEYNIAVIEDIRDIGFNTVGNKASIKPFDGATFVNPFMVYLENKSLGSNAAGITKKQFIHGYDNDTGTGIIIKTAGFGLTNNWIRRSEFMQGLMRQMTTHKWIDENGNNLTIDITFGKDGIDSVKEYNKIYFQSEINLQTGQLVSEETPGQKVKYYRVSRINRQGQNTYHRELQEVNLKTGEIGRKFIESTKTQDGQIVPKNFVVDNNYALWQLFGGTESMSIVNGKLELSEESIKNVVEAMNKIAFDKQGKQIPVDDLLNRNEESEELYISQSQVYQPLKHSDIHYEVTAGAIKHGAGNINSAKLYSTEGKSDLLDFFKMKITQAGIQLDKEHHADEAELSLMTQVISACGAKGYTFEQAESIYQALSALSEIGLKDFNDPIVESVLVNEDESLEVAFRNLIVNKLAQKETTAQNFTTRIVDEIYNKVLQATSKKDKDAALLKAILPSSNQALYNQIVATVTIALNQSSIKQAVSGVLSVLTPSYKIEKLRNGLRASEIQDKYPGKTFAEKLLNMQKDFQSNSQNCVVPMSDPMTDFSKFDLTKLQIGTPYLVREMAAGQVEHTESDFVNTANFLSSYKQITLNDIDDLNNLRREILNGKYNFVVENLLEGRDLAPQTTKFYGSDGIRYQLWNIDSTVALRFLELNKNQFSEQTEFARLYQDFRNYVNLENLKGNLDLLTKHCKRYFELHPDVKEKDQTLLYRFVQLNEKFNNVYMLNENFSTLLDSDLPNSLISKIKLQHQRDLQNLTLGTHESHIEALQQLINEYEHSTDADRLEQFDLRLKYILNSTENELLINEYELYNSLKAHSSVIDQSNQHLKVVPINNQNIQDIFNLLKDIFVNRDKISIDDKLIEINRDSIEVTGYEIIMPKNFATRFGLEKFDQVSEIVNDPDFFYKRLVKNFGTNVELNSLKFTFDLKTIRGQHYYILDTRNHQYEQLMKNGRGLKPISIYTDESPKGTNRIINGKPIYSIQENDKFYIDPNSKVEIIATDNPEFYLNELDYSYINISESADQRKAVDILRNSSNKRANNYANILDREGTSDGRQIRARNFNANNLSSEHNTAEKILREMAKEIHTSFMAYLDVLAARIPAQSLQSFMSMRIAGFEDADVNNAYVSTMQLWLQGSDYDIDTVNLVTYIVNHNGKLETWSPYTKYGLESQTPIERVKELKNSMKYLPFPTGEITEIQESSLEFTKEFYRKYKSLFNFKNFESNHTLRNKIDLLSHDENTNDPTYDIKLLGSFLREKYIPKVSLKDADAFNTFFRQEIAPDVSIENLYPTSLDDAMYALSICLQDIINYHNEYYGKVKGDKAEQIVMNYLQFGMEQVAKDPANFMQAMSSVDDITDPIKNLAKKSPEHKQATKMTPGNFIYLYEAINSNQVGKQCIAINAIGIKTFFNAGHYYNAVLNKRYSDDEARKLCELLGINPLTGDEYTAKQQKYLLFPKGIKIEKAFKEGGVTKYSSKEYKLLTDVRAKSPATVRQLEVLRALLKINRTKDTALDFSALIGLSADNAKELILSQLRISPKTNGMYCAGLMLGMTMDEISDLFTGDTGSLIIKLSDGDSFTGKKDSGTNMDKIFDYLDTVRVPKIMKGTADEFLKALTPEQTGGHDFSDYGQYLKKLRFNECKKEFDKLVKQFIKENALRNESEEIITDKNGNPIPDPTKVTPSVLRDIQSFKEHLFYANIVYDSTNAKNQKDLKNIKLLYTLGKDLFNLGRITSLNQGIKTKADDLYKILDIFKDYGIDLQKFIFGSNEKNELAKELKRQIEEKEAQFKETKDVPNKTKIARELRILKAKFNEESRKSALRYQNDVIESFENSKTLINIPHMIVNVPHLFKYVKTLATAEQLLNQSLRFRTIKSQTDRLIDHFYLTSKSTKKEIEGSRMKRKSVREGINNFITTYLRQQFMKGTTIVLPRGQKYFNSKGQLLTATTDIPIQLGTDWGDATFRRFIENKIIPDLKKGLNVNLGNETSDGYQIRDNRLIKNLDWRSYNKTVSGDDTLIYTLPSVNLSPRNDSERSVLQAYQIEMNNLKKYQYKIPLKTQIGYTRGKTEFTVPELLIYYTMLSQNFRPGQSTLTNLFSNFKSDLLNDYNTFIDGADRQFNIEFGKNVPWSIIEPYILPHESIITGYSKEIYARNPETGHIVRYIQKEKTSNRSEDVDNAMPDEEIDWLEDQVQHNRTKIESKYYPLFGSQGELKNTKHSDLSYANSRYFPAGSIVSTPTLMYTFDTGSKIHNVEIKYDPETFKIKSIMTIDSELNNKLQKYKDKDLFVSTVLLGENNSNNAGYLEIDNDYIETLIENEIYSCR